MDRTPTTPAPAATGSRRPAALQRAADDRLVAGVCGGLGARLGLDAVVLRLALVPLALAGLAGVVAYLVLWALFEDPPDAEARHHPQAPPATTEQLVAVAMVVTGLLLLLRAMGLWFGDGVVWPVAVATFGAAVAWARDDEASVMGLRRRGASAPPFAPAAVDGSVGAALRRAGPVRVLAGAGLVLAGMVGFLAANTRLTALVDVLLAATAVLLGVALVLGPWLVRLVGQLADERRERIRSEERTAMATHLHDSVLQTLALVQRTADQPARTRALARRQERELRAWLHGGPGPGTAADGAPQTLGAALARLATEAEQDADVRVEAVVVGDGPMTEAAGQLLAAVREAVANAARHAGVDHVDVFVEAQADTGQLTATVRDRGLGFDPDLVADDRHGVRHSIRGRLRRAGGGATLRTGPGEGTEWELWVPLRRDRGGDDG